jgi:hypothetical protein
MKEDALSNDMKVQETSATMEKDAHITLLATETLELVVSYLPTSCLGCLSITCKDMRDNLQQLSADFWKTELDRLEWPYKYDIESEDCRDNLRQTLLLTALLFDVPSSYKMPAAGCLRMPP